MILSASTIRRIKPIDPFIEKTVINGKSAGLSHAGYDIRIGRSINLGPKQFGLSVSVERFNIPKNIMAFVHDKSSWMRQGLSVGNTVIEPGWEGYLTLELFNQNNFELFISKGDPIAQIVFHQIDTEVEGYKGKYQGDGPEPQPYKVEVVEWDVQP